MPYLLDTNVWIHYLKIGPYDLQIAAICVRHGLTLVTSNVGEFSRVQGLVTEDWLVP